MLYGGLVDADVMFIAKSVELLPSELCIVVLDDGVWDPKAMDDVEEDNTAHSNLIVEIGRASIHFVNLSMVTSKWVYPLGAFLSGPTRSSPQTANSQVMGIVWSAWAGK